MRRRPRGPRSRSDSCTIPVDDSPYGERSVPKRDHHQIATLAHDRRQNRRPPPRVPHRSESRDETRLTPQSRQIKLLLHVPRARYRCIRGRAPPRFDKSSIADPPSSLRLILPDQNPPPIAARQTSQLTAGRSAPLYCRSVLHNAQRTEATADIRARFSPSDLAAALLSTRKRGAS